MLNYSRIKHKSHGSRNIQNEKRLWHDSKINAPSLGCTICPDKLLCGGINIDRPFYSCLDFCCGNIKKCDSICRNKPHDFVMRVREIGGFDLNNVPRTKPLLLSAMPSVIPVIFHGNCRRGSFNTPSVCLPLYKVIPRHGGGIRFSNIKSLTSAFHISEETTIILTGTDKDAPLERWWSMGEKRLQVIRGLKDLGVKLITSPNYSLFTDQPRWDDLHSMKRIAITHEEFLRVGIPAALHVNARTERDWERWTKFIIMRSEINQIAFEFRTGAGWAGRVNWQIDQLINLAREVGRPLYLIVRAANDESLLRLVNAYANVMLIETNTFMKTIYRQKASLRDEDKIKWETYLTLPNTALDELLEHNWSIINHKYAAILGKISKQYLKKEGCH